MTNGERLGYVELFDTKTGNVLADFDDTAGALQYVREVIGPEHAATLELLWNSPDHHVTGRAMYDDFIRQISDWVSR